MKNNNNKKKYKKNEKKTYGVGNGTVLSPHLLEYC